MKTRAMTLVPALLAAAFVFAAIPCLADGGSGGSQGDGGQQKITVHVGKVTKNPDQGGGGKQDGQGSGGGQSDGGKKSQGGSGGNNGR